MTRARIAAIACLAAGVALLAIGLFGHGWGRLDGGTVGLRDTICSAAHGCDAGPHGSTPATKLEGEQFAIAGQLALMLGALAALAGAAIAVRASLARALAMPATVLAIGAAGAATTFVVIEPFFLHWQEQWHAGSAWWIFTAGAALVAIGARIGPPELADRPRAWLPAVALALAAIALALTARSTSWWQGPGDWWTDGAGPAEAVQCDDQLGCRELRLSDVPETVVMQSMTPAQRLVAPQAGLMGEVAGEVMHRARFDRTTAVAGRIVVIAATVAAVLAAALAAAALSRRRARALAWMTIAGALALGAAIALFLHGDPLSQIDHVLEVQRSYGLGVALAGVALAIVPAAWLARRGPTTTTTTTATAVDEIPTCAACGVPMLWVGKREIWLCTRCKARGSVTP